MYPPPETEQAWLKAHALVFGENTGDLLATFDPEQSLWRMLQGFSLWGEVQFLQTLPRWVMWDESGLYQLPMPVHLTSETAFGLWPTPSTTDSSVRKLEPENAHETANGTLRYVNSEGQQSFARLSQVVLHDEAQKWATPQKRDYKNTSKPSDGRIQRKLQQGWSLNLNEQTLWSTPAAQDAKNATLPASQAMRDTLPGDLMNTEPETIQMEMNPAWEETLMGLPPGWTDLSASPAIGISRSMPMNRRVFYRAARRLIVERGSKR